MLCALPSATAPRRPAPLQHACTFDFVKHDRDVLARLNPKVAGEKLGEKI